MSAAAPIESARFERPPPPEFGSISAEQAVLGGLLIGGVDAWLKIDPPLVPDDFSKPAHKCIFDAIATLARAGEPTDPATVAERFPQDIKLAGGLTQLGELARNTPTAATIGDYVAIVRERSKLRWLWLKGQQICESVKDSADLGADALVARAQSDLAALKIASPTPQSRFVGINFADMKPRLGDDYIVKGFIGPKTLVADVGPSGCGKTFFIADLALHIASGTAWRGHRVKKGLVVVVELEGAASAENRLYAANLDKRFGNDIALKMTPGPLNLRDSADVLALVAFIQAAETEFKRSISVCVVDTLSRALAGGDENGPEDMGNLIKGADYVRTVTGAAVILVHHTGKDESRGGRGHSSLYAALDTEIVITLSGDVRVATVTKQRDLPSGARYPFRLDVVEVGRDSEGDLVTTCVVRAAEEPGPVRPIVTGKNQSALMAALQEWQRAHDGASHISSLDMRAIAKAQGIKSNRLGEVIESLSKVGCIGPAVGGYSLSLESP